LQLPVLAIKLILVLMLGLFKAVPNMEQEFILFLQLMVHSGQTGTEVIQEKGWRVPTIDHIEWRRLQ
jgi:hypothetical protein